MAKVFGAVEINKARCKGCDLCAVACPCDVLKLSKRDVNERGYLYAQVENPDKCIGCAACALVCPDSCIEVYRLIEAIPHEHHGASCKKAVRA